MEASIFIQEYHLLAHIYNVYVFTFKYAPFFFFNDTATTEIYTLSLHDALPILNCARSSPTVSVNSCVTDNGLPPMRSEEHTSELQSRPHLVCRLLLEKKNCEPSQYGRRGIPPTI